MSLLKRITHNILLYQVRIFMYLIHHMNMYIYVNIRIFTYLVQHINLISFNSFPILFIYDKHFCLIFSIDAWLQKRIPCPNSNLKYFTIFHELWPKIWITSVFFWQPHVKIEKFLNNIFGWQSLSVFFRFGVRVIENSDIFQYKETMSTRNALLHPSVCVSEDRKPYRYNKRLVSTLIQVTGKSIPSRSPHSKLFKRR